MNDIRSHSRSRRINRTVLPYKGAKPCFYCGAPAVEVDHLVPVVKGGKHDRSNLVPACRRCNASKGARAQPKPIVAVSRSVFSTPRNHTPASCRFSLPLRRYATIRGDLSRTDAE